MRGASQQVMLDSFFGSLGDDGDLHRGMSDRGFAKARDRLSWNALQRLNTFVVQTADRLGLIERWQGLRVVAADASVFFPAVRACANLKGFAASPNQRLFSLFLPGAELTLFAQVHGEHTAERQMFFLGMWLIAWYSLRSPFLKESRMGFAARPGQIDLRSR